MSGGDLLDGMSDALAAGAGASEQDAYYDRLAQMLFVNPREACGLAGEVPSSVSGPLEPFDDEQDYLLAKRLLSNPMPPPSSGATLQAHGGAPCTDGSLAEPLLWQTQVGVLDMIDDIELELCRSVRFANDEATRNDTDPFGIQERPSKWARTLAASSDASATTTVSVSSVEPICHSVVPAASSDASATAVSVSSVKPICHSVVPAASSDVSAQTAVSTHISHAVSSRSSVEPISGPVVPAAVVSAQTAASPLPRTPSDYPAEVVTAAEEKVLARLRLTDEDRQQLATAYIRTHMCQAGLPNIEKCLGHIESLAAEFFPASFTIGITGGPAYRFFNVKFPGYFWKGYQKMIILHRGTGSQGAQLEKDLISVFHTAHDTRCLNVLKGGENAPKGVCFTYCAIFCNPTRRFKQMRPLE